ncbi:MAG: UvrD-helicase domain-containing protein [Bacteroidota bacterium]
MTSGTSRFVEGPAGSGKTSYAIGHIQRLIESGVEPEQILLFTPQRSYTLQYEQAFDTQTWYRLGKATIGGLAGRMVGLFWPLVDREKYPFESQQSPAFLTYEVAQYFMSRLVKPLIEEGYFSDLKLTLPRLYSQLLDNLNKASANGIPLESVGQYLKDAAGLADSDEQRYEDIAQTIEAYRTFCISNNLLDFSLSLALFWDLYQQGPEVHNFLDKQYSHLVYDNCEEDIPIAHDFITKFLPALDTACVLFDNNAGYRRFLGASPRSAYKLSEQCSERVVLADSHVQPPALQVLQQLVAEEIVEGDLNNVPVEAAVEPHFVVHSDRLHQDMVLRAADHVVKLVAEGVAPADIAIISPYLSESVHFGLGMQLDKHEVAHQTHRPSRDLLSEPVTRVMLTVAQLAHPAWQLPRPSREAVTYMFNRLLAGADLVRAALLGGGVYAFVSEDVGLKPFEELEPEMRDRITYNIGAQYDRLRSWIIDYRAGDPLPIDHFFSKLFGEVLSQEGFGFLRDVEAGVDTGRLVESARKFRQAVGPVLDAIGLQVGEAYVDMVQQGVISAFYRIDWEEEDNAVLITPAHTFLLKNRAYKHQIWLDVGSTSWHRRIQQPLTNPYVLTKYWQQGRKWNAEMEQFHEKERLTALVKGLLNRCSDVVLVCFSELSAYGQEQTGMMREVMNNVMRHLAVSPATEE